MWLQGQWRWIVNTKEYKYRMAAMDYQMLWWDRHRISQARSKVYLK